MFPNGWYILVYHFQFLNCIFVREEERELKKRVREVQYEIKMSHHFYFALIVIVAITINGSHAATSAQSCSMINGQWRCTSNNDPNGNSAVAYSGSDGQMYSGQGTPINNFNPNFGAFGNPGNFFPFGPQFPFFGRRR